MARSSRVHLSIKHGIISRDSTIMLVVIGVSVFIVIFCLFAMRALIGQSNFNRKVIAEKRIAIEQLEENKKAVDQLRQVFVAFSSENPNLLGGNANGSGPLDGNNAKLVVDALPGSYSLPALTSSFEKLLFGGGYDVGGLGGTDAGEAAVAPVATTPSGTSSQPSAPAIPYGFSVNGNQQQIQQLLATLDKSIRPMKLTSLSLRGTSSAFQATIALETYFSPGISFELSTKEVK